MKKKLHLNKKVYIKDIKDSEYILEKLLFNNNELKEEVYNKCCDDNMFFQEEFGNLCLGNDWCKYIKLYDNYSSFYLRITNYSNFIENIDKDYLSNEELELYKKAIELKTKIDNLYYDDEDVYTDEFEKKCDKLLGLIEKDLHKYEDYICDDDLLEYFTDICMINNWYDDLYYYKNKFDYILFEDITKCYC